MPKFSGHIGFTETIEIEPGIWEERITERFYYGELTRNTRRLQISSTSVNDNVNVSNEISIVADPYATQNYLNMRYIVFMGAKWKIETVDVKYPRLVLSIGGLYNERQTQSAE